MHAAALNEATSGRQHHLYRCVQCPRGTVGQVDPEMLDPARSADTCSFLVRSRDVQRQ
jgi:hypothetical protein